MHFQCEGDASIAKHIIMLRLYSSITHFSLWMLQILNFIPTNFPSILSSQFSSCSSILFVHSLTLSQYSNKEFFLFKREEGKCGLAIAVFSLGSQDKRIRKWKHFLVKYFYSLPAETVWCRADWRGSGN